MFFGEVTGASREPVLAEGDYADVVAAPGRRATWGNSKSYPSPCVPAPLYLSISPHPPNSFSLTHCLSLTHIRKYTNTTHQIILFTQCHSSIYSSTVFNACLYFLTPLCVYCFHHYEFIAEKLIVTSGITSFIC